MRQYLFVVAIVFGGLRLIYNLKAWTIEYGPLGGFAAIWVLILAVFTFVCFMRAIR